MLCFFSFLTYQSFLPTICVSSSFVSSLYFLALFSLMLSIHFTLKNATPEIYGKSPFFCLESYIAKKNHRLKEQGRKANSPDLSVSFP